MFGTLASPPSCDSIVNIKTLLVWAGLGESPSPLQSSPVPTHQPTGELGGDSAQEELAEEIMDEPVPAGPQNTAIGSFLALTGFQPTAHYHSFAHVTEVVFCRTLDSWEINGAYPNMSQMGAVSLAWHKARQLCHLEAVPSPADFVPPQQPAPSSSNEGQPRQTTASGNILNLRTIKVAAHLDQRSSSEITFLPTAEIQKMYARYVAAWHEMPSADVNPTPEQLASLKHTVDAGMPPYADLAVVGPHGVRFQKKQMMSGLTLNRDGQFVNTECYGPPTFEAWTSCYDVLAALLIMIGAVGRPALSAYFKLIKMLHAMYGSSVWHLLYQTDVRCRQELMEAIFHELLAAHNTALEIGSHTTFDPESPWDQVWTVATNRARFWTDQFERPAGMITTRVRQMGSVIDGDVQIMHTPNQVGAAPTKAGAPNPKVKQAPKNRGAAQKAKQQTKRDSPPCVICKSADHAMTACPSYDKDHVAKKGKKGKGKGK